MNRFARPLTALAIAGVMAACAPAADEGASVSSSPLPAPTDAPTDAPRPSESLTPEPSESASASASAKASASASPHDMGGTGGTDETATVEIVNFDFDPVELTVSAGTEVTFTNLDAFSHTVTAGTGDAPMPDDFDSGRLPEGTSFQFAFDEPGTYVYYCELHPAMEASIIVEN